MFTSSGCWVGIDVSKAYLDVVFGSAGSPFRVPNTPAGFAKLLQHLMGTDVTGIVAESTGFYHRGVTTYLWEQGYPLSIINPKFARNFRKSGLKLAKTDALDARLLARFGEDRAPAVMFPKHGAVQMLSDLVSARHDHVQDKTAWRNRRQNHHLPAIVHQEIEASIQMQVAAIARLEQTIAEVIASDPVLAARDVLFQSVPGIALVRSATLLAFLPELGTVGNATVASLVGLAPHAQDSGAKSGHRYVHGGRAVVKGSLVFMAQSPQILHPIVRARRQRFLEAGKMSWETAVAVARWLVTILNTMVTNNLKWKELDIVRTA